MYTGLNPFRNDPVWARNGLPGNAVLESVTGDALNETKRLFTQQTFQIQTENWNHTKNNNPLNQLRRRTNSWSNINENLWDYN